ncbi:MAG TPA: protein kinase [Gemmatimonadales bacterium]|nr:protein kinase [Gemmatimonadales bacterium]
MKCFRCGSTIGDDQRFCGKCGALVSADPHSETLAVETGGGEDQVERLRRVLSGEFEVDAELARGGMSVIYKARDVTLARSVALKVLPPELGLTVRAVERFQREARMAAELEHPNIVPVYRVGHVGDVLFIAMKYVEGRSLDAVVAEQGAVPVPVVLHVLRAALRALVYAHDRGIVHRDVKTANLLVDTGGRVLVSDFGVALRASDVTLTQDGAVIGTPAYMSPEQCAGRRAGPQSDQYSLGIVAFQLLAGAVPFDSDNLPGFINHHLHTPAPDVRAARDDVPEPLAKLVQRSLAKRAEDRFADTRDMLAAVEALPFPEEDRRGSEDVLSRLANGSAVPRVATRSIPVLAEMPTLSLRPAPRWQRAAVWSGVALATLVAGAAIAARRPPAVANGLAVGDSTHLVVAPPIQALTRRVQMAPADAGTGKLRLRTDPPDANIYVDGKLVGQGVILDYVTPTGDRRIEVEANGYQRYVQRVSVARDGTVNLGLVTLRPATARP